jgi:hypothetical protein
VLGKARIGAWAQRECHANVCDLAHSLTGGCRILIIVSLGTAE